MITVQPRRKEALEAGFLAMQGRLPAEFSFTEFCERLTDWRVDAFCDGERPVGMLMVRGPELHVAVISEVRGKWLSRRLIREVFAPILERYGQAKTRIADGNDRGLDFVRRIRAGFADLTFDPTTALLSAGGSLLSSAMQSGASQTAAGQASNAANNATNAQLQMFNTQNQQQLPYRQAGQTALGDILSGFSNAGPKTLDQFKQDQLAQTNQNLINKFGAGTKTLDPNDPNQQTIYGGMSEADQIADVYKQAQTAFDQQQSGGQTGAVPGGYFTHQFNAGDLNSNLAPNYQFQLQQGLGAVQNAGNLQTGLVSGNTMKGINDYAQNFAGNAYQNAFNNYTTNQNNIFGRLSNIAGLGSAANQQSASLAGSIAPSVSGSMQNAGAAQAAGTIGSANALAGGGSNALGWYNLSQMTNPNGISDLMDQATP